MVHANRLSRGDLRRNARLDRLRRVISADRAVLAVDLADDKQVLVLTDHDSKVLARRTVRCRPWALDQALRWGLATARASGFASVVVACEPTGHRWRVVAEHAAGLGVELVCVQPMLVRRAREAEDFTRDKSDNKDALLIARLATQLHCYLPERPTMAWARLRHLGARRVEQTTRATAAQQRLRDLLECAWPAALAPAVAAWPLDSLTWRAAMTVGRCDPARIRALGWARFARAVDRELPRWGGQRRCARILRAVWIAANGGGGVTAQRPGALERAAFVLADFHQALGELAEVEARMAAVLAELGLGELVATIPGVSAVGAAAILAETGDPTRFDSPAPCQARRPVPTRGRLGCVCRQDHDLRPGPAAAATGRMAGKLGCTAPQPGLGGPLRPPDHPGTQPAHRRPGPHRSGGGPATSAVGRVRHPGPLGSRGGRWRCRQGGDRPGSISDAGVGGASPTWPWEQPVDQPGQPRPPPSKLGCRLLGRTRLAARWSWEAGQGTAHNAPTSPGPPAHGPARSHDSGPHPARPPPLHPGVDPRLIGC
jgi:transposase